MFDCQKRQSLLFTNLTKNKSLGLKEMEFNRFLTV